MYDRMSAKTEDAGLREVRRRLLADAEGRVLEIGGGTGANLLLYGPSVESLTVTEPEQPMLRRLDRKVREQAPLTKVLRASAEELPFPDNSFDTVVSTLVLCGVEDQTQSLREVRRVLRPGGRFLFIEHVRADSTRLARWQDRLQPAWKPFGLGCHCNRDTVGTLLGAGWKVDEVQRFAWRGMPFIVKPVVAGWAAPPTS